MTISHHLNFSPIEEEPSNKIISRQQICCVCSVILTTVSFEVSGYMYEAAILCKHCSQRRLRTEVRFRQQRCCNQPAAEVLVNNLRVS